MLMNYTKRKELSDGSIHIKNGVYIQKFIDEHLL